MSSHTIALPDYAEAAAYILPFDKFQGSTLAQAAAADPAYVRWLATQMVPRNELGQRIKAMAIAYLQGAQAGNGNGHQVAPPPAANERPDERPEAVRIYSEITRSVILHVEDALAIGKLRLFLLSYQRGQGAQATAAHYLDVEDARVLAFDLAVRGGLPERFVDYKGSAHGPDGQPQSRVLRLEDRGEGQRAPIVLQLSQGPGAVVGEGRSSRRANQRWRSPFCSHAGRRAAWAMPYKAICRPGRRSR